MNSFIYRSQIMKFTLPEPDPKDVAIFAVVMSEKII